MPIIIKNRYRDVYLGKYCIDGARQAVKDIKHAKRYISVAKAKAAVETMGYRDTDEVEYIWIDEPEKPPKPEQPDPDQMMLF